MAALAELMDFRDARGGEARRGWLRRQPHGREAVQMLELSSKGFHAFAANAPSLGEEIRVHVPALGLLEARVIWADAREFRAEFCGAENLRLLFLRNAFVGCSSWFERSRS